MKIKKLNVGYLMTNCYIVYDEESGESLVIDPGGDAGRILSALEKTETKLRYILLTHGHYDHTGAADELSRRTGVPVYIHPADLLDNKCDFGTQLFYSPAPDISIRHLAEGDVLPLGGHEIKVLSTPGHSWGSCVFIIDREMFAGDTLFAGSCGRTDFTGGSTEKMMASLKRLRDLPGDYNVYPGHESASTLERERMTNYYMMDLT